MTDSTNGQHCAWCDRAVTDPNRAVTLHASDGETLWTCDAGCLAGVITDLGDRTGATRLQ